MGIGIRPRHGDSNDNCAFGRGMPWILCDLMPHGKRLVRGSPDNPKAFWTFCPKKKFPHDKIKVSRCKNCSHFQGFRKTFSNKVVQNLEEFGTLSRAFRIKKKDDSSQFRIQKRKEPRGKVITEKMLAKAVERQKKEDKEWEKKEKELFSTPKDT